MAQYTQSRMCGECPFRAKSPKGWLGPWTIDQMEKFIRYEGIFICHTEVQRLEEEGFDEIEIEVDGEHCVGILRYMNSTFKLAHDRRKVAAQQRLKTIPDQPLIAPFKFREHHSGPLNA